MIINPDWFNDELEEESLTTNFFNDFISNIDDAFQIFQNKFTLDEWMYIFGCNQIP